MAPTAGSGRYIKGIELGKGTFGVVYKATDTLTNRIVAIKKIHLGQLKEGVNVTALREIKLLKELHHPHVIELVDVFPHKRNLNLVFEYMENDLEAIIRDRNIVLSPGDIKSYMQMTLKGLAFCHSKWVLHRDMKPNNLLLAPNGELKLGDFGLARIFGSPDRKLTQQVFARWYRAPELLYGSRQYGAGVDVWAAACIFAELLLRRPFLQGSSDIDQLGRIFSALGTPRESQWPDMKYLPDYVEYVYTPATPLRAHFPMASDDALDLLSKMLTFDPNQRITVQQALEHRYFRVGPPPADRQICQSLRRGWIAHTRRQIWNLLMDSLPSLLRPKRSSRKTPFTGPHLGFGYDREAADRTRTLAAREAEGEDRGRPDKGSYVRNVAPSRSEGFLEEARLTPNTARKEANGSGRGSLDQNGDLAAPSVTPMQRSGVGVDDPTLNARDVRPTLDSADRNYLRKRKLDLDSHFLDEG